MIRPVPALLGLALALAPAAAPCAPSQSYRVNYQLVRPLNADFRFAVLGSLTQTPGSTGPGDRTTLVVVPAGVEYKIDRNWSAQGYLQLNKDFYSFGPDKLEVRPVFVRKEGRTRGQGRLGGPGRRQRRQGRRPR